MLFPLDLTTGRCFSMLSQHRETSFIIHKDVAFLDDKASVLAKMQHLANTVSYGGRIFVAFHVGGSQLKIVSPDQAESSSGEIPVIRGRWNARVPHFSYQQKDSEQWWVEGIKSAMVRQHQGWVTPSAFWGHGWSPLREAIASKGLAYGATTETHENGITFGTFRYRKWGCDS